MNTNMNPSNPDTPGGMPAPAAPGQPQEQSQGQPSPEPKTIRDYLVLARSQGQVPRFTNIDDAPGFDIRQDPGYIPSRGEQAISEGPQSEYEKEPWDQRVKKDPYIRTQQSLMRFLPEMWEIMYPGQEPGMLAPDSPEAEKWDDAVQGLTGSLLKKYSKQHDWEMKNRNRTKEQRAKDEQYWQKFYATQDAKQQPPLNEDGSRMTETEFIDKQMGIADERRMKSEIGDEEDKAGADAEGSQEGIVNTLNDMQKKDIQRAIQNSPELAAKIKAKVIENMSAIVGEQVSEEDFFAFRHDTRWQDVFRAEVRKVIGLFEEDVVTVANGGMLTADPVEAAPSNPVGAAPSNAPQILSGQEPGFAGSQTGMDVPMGMS